MNGTIYAMSDIILKTAVVRKITCPFESLKVSWVELVLCQELKNNILIWPADPIIKDSCMILKTYKLSRKILRDRMCV